LSSGRGGALVALDAAQISAEAQTALDGIRGRATA
jgi:hypothetical protein